MWKIALWIVFVSAVECCVYKNRECPDYTLLRETPDYEIRSYPSLTWVSTRVESRILRIAQYRAFMRLYRYITGNNDRGLAINMTVPVRSQTKSTEIGTAVTMSFMIPSRLANNPPIPNDEDVVVAREQRVMYAVRTFEGYVWRDRTWKSEAKNLAELLSDDDSVLKSTYYRVGYDAPFDFRSRKNEIWMLKTEEH